VDLPGPRVRTKSAPLGESLLVPKGFGVREISSDGSHETAGRGTAASYFAAAGAAEGGAAWSPLRSCQKSSAAPPKNISTEISSAWVTALPKRS
jgi:hypothetical protein